MQSFPESVTEHELRWLCLERPVPSCMHVRTHMRMCTHVHTHTCVCTCTRGRAHAYAHTHMHPHVRTHTPHMQTRAHTRTHTHAHAHAPTRAHTHTEQSFNLFTVWLSTWNWLQPGHVGPLLQVLYFKAYCNYFGFHSNVCLSKNVPFCFGVIYCFDMINEGPIFSWLLQWKN